MDKDEILEDNKMSNVNRQTATGIISELIDEIKERYYLVLSLANEHDISFSVQLDYIDGVRYGHNQVNEMSWNSSSAYC